MTADEARALVTEYESIIQEPTTPESLPTRNRRAIDLHGRIDKAWDNGDSTLEVLDIIKDLNDRILLDIFGVDPATRKRIKNA
jgi:hypothetical protein